MHSIGSLFREGVVPEWKACEMEFLLLSFRNSQHQNYDTVTQ